MDLLSRYQRLTPLVLLAFALLLRLYGAVVPGMITPDGVLYINTARMIEAGQWQRVSEESFYTIYPFLIVLFQKIIPNWETAGRMVSVTFGSLAVLPLYLLFKRIFDARIAVAVVIAFTVSHKILEFSSNVLREPVFWCFSLFALWAAWEGISRRKWFMVTAAGFFAGLSAMARMEGIALIGIITLWMVWVLLYKEHRVRTFLIYALVVLVIFPATFAVPLTLLKAETGRWELGLVGSRLPTLITGDSDEVLAARASESAGPQTPASVPERSSARNQIHLAVGLLSKYFGSFPVIFLGLLFFGVFRRRVYPCSDREIPVLIWLFVYLAVSWAYMSRTGYLSTRHGLLMGIPSFLWVGIGFFELNERIRRLVRSKAKRLTARHATFLFVAVLSAAILPRTLAWPGHEKVEMKKAGIYLKGAGHLDDKLAVELRLTRLVFYADANYVVIPGKIRASAMYDFLVSVKAAYLIVDEKNMGPAVREFIKNSAPTTLERIPVPEFEGYKRYSFAVFRIRKP
ncbi:MAG: glycosyltransferase family 39 protein [Syntrophorhabdaceae bacterium]|nr:glycosyltransferase family 39 protein [Syntrophorhabdaceae bacterium]